MAQQSITSFFNVHKRKAPPETKTVTSKTKERRVDSKTPQKPTSAPLNTYALGNAVTSDLTTDPEAEKRHKRFYEQIAGHKSRESRQSGRRAMKPYDQQFIELKRQNEDSILMIQNGYKYQILGEDAYRASRYLGRSPVSGWRSLTDSGDPQDCLYDRFASLTFPIERLPFYVEKLVMQGLKVAVAKQIETSALKAEGSNKRGPFQREVTDVYTKGTMVEELSASSVVSGHLLALKETNTGFAFIAVQLATGSGMYDSFSDDKSVAMELETRLLHILPSEILVVGSKLEGVAARMVASLDVRTIQISECHKNVKIDDLKTEDPRFEDASMSSNAKDIPEYIMEEPDLLECWHAVRQYLEEFSLTHALDLGLEPFTLRSFMFLGGDTLNSLEIYENQTTNEKRGSLFWALDATKTPFGRRRLRNWIGRPLLDRELLNERTEAMEEIMNVNNTESKIELFDTLRSNLAKMPDLERHTLQTYHGRINPRQLYWFLYHFKNLLACVTTPEIVAAKIHSPLLQSILNEFAPTLNIIEPLLQKISPAAARGSYSTNTYTSNGGKNGGVDLTQYFKFRGIANEELDDDLITLKNFDEAILKCRSDFTEFVEEQARELELPIKQVSPIGEEDTFVIGVPKSKASKIPTSWSRQGAISTEVRYWAPYSFEQTKKLKPLLEKQAIAAQLAYDNFVAALSDSHFNSLRKCVSHIATLDCLFSMATISSRPQYVKPDLVDGYCLEIEDGRHPMLEQLILGDVIPNSVQMHAEDNRVMIITGANMGGKSSYVRQVALLVIMAQIGLYIPAKSARLSLMDAVFTRMGAFDNLMRGESTFMVELKECSAIMAKASLRSLVIMDEIGRGTSTMDGVAIADAVLRFVIESLRCFTLFITHYPLLSENADRYPAVENWSMDCSESKDEVTFLFKIVRRQASQSYGINVARLAGLPESILQAAEQKSSEFAAQIEDRRKASQLLQLIRSVFQDNARADNLIEELRQCANSTESLNMILDSQADDATLKSMETREEKNIYKY